MSCPSGGSGIESKELGYPQPPYPTQLLDTNGSSTTMDSTKNRGVYGSTKNRDVKDHADHDQYKHRKYDNEYHGKLW